MQKYLTIAVICATVSGVASGGGIGGIGDMPGYTTQAVCAIKYECGTGATGTAPAEISVSSGKTFTPAANTCAKDGYVFSHYLATVSDSTEAQDGVAKPGVTYTIPFDGSNTCAGGLTITLTPQWVAASGTSVVSAKSYTDSELLTRQPNFTASATDKLILFSGSTNGAFGERAVVTSLGTPNSTSGLYSGTDLSSTEVPINRAVNTGVNRKQATVNGTANYVAMYDSNAHMTGGSKGIYNASSLTDLDTLVEAGTLNSAIVDAVNSELIQVGLDGQPSASGVLWKLNTAGNLSLLGPASGGGGSGSGGASSLDLSWFRTYDEEGEYWYASAHSANDGGPSGCEKSLSGNQVNAGWCEADVAESIGLPVAGRSAMSYGDWYEPMYNPDDEERHNGYAGGISACSELASTSGDVEIASNQTKVQQDYQNNMAAAPTNNPIGQNCYCKLTNLNGTSVSSSWVFVGNISTDNGWYGCENADGCTVRCAYEFGYMGEAANMMLDTLSY